MFLHRVTASLLLLSLAAGSAAAQSATFRGRVLDSAEEPMDGVNVVLKSEAGRLFGASTTDGFYLITRVPPGTYSLTVSFVGFVTINDTLAFASGDNVSRNFVLEEDESQLGAITVVSERGDANQYIAGLRTLRAADLQLLTSANASRDLASALVVESGVVTIGDRGGQIFVRGSTPTQNIFLLDGMRVFQPLHLINSFSVYPVDIVAFADVYSSGYGAYYGGRTGAVIDVTTRNGSKERISGSLGISPFMATGHVELPVVEGRVSVLASARQSLLTDYGMRVINEELPYRYGDRFLKLHAFLNETSNFSITALRSNDRGNLAGDPLIDRTISWTNEAYGANYFYLSPELPVLTEITIGKTRFAMEKFEGGEVLQSSSVEGVEGSFNFGYLLGAYQVHFGIFAQSTAFRYALGVNSSDRVTEFVTEGGIFLEARMNPAPGVHLVPGARVQTFPSRNQTYLEPRLRASMPLSSGAGNWSLSGTWGIYHQELIGLSDDRSVSDVFTAWAPSQANRPVPKSIHYSVGVATEEKRWKGSVEAYYRSIDNLGFPALGEPLSVNTRFLSVTGFSRGVDFSAEYRWPRAFTRVSYGLAQTRYEADGDSFSPPHDRRHTLTVLGQLNWRSARISAQWQFGSGLPYTQINGVYQRVPVTREDGVTAEVGPRAALFGESYSARLPAYHRLDVSVERDIQLPAGAQLTLQASAVNTYNRRNWFDFDFESLRRINQLPFIPSFGLRVTM